MLIHTKVLRHVVAAYEQPQLHDGWCGQSISGFC